MRASGSTLTLSWRTSPRATPSSHTPRGGLNVVCKWRTRSSRIPGWGTWLPLGRLAIIATLQVVLLQYALDIRTSLMVVAVVCLLSAFTDVSSGKGGQFVGRLAAGVAAAISGTSVDTGGRGAAA